MRQYSDDRKALAIEIMETLKTRGHWVPKDYEGPDIIMAVGKALDRTLLENRELLEALQNMTGLFGEAVTRHQMGKGFSELHAAAVKGAKDALRKYPEKQICEQAKRVDGCFMCTGYVIAGVPCPEHGGVRCGGAMPCKLHG